MAEETTPQARRNRGIVWVVAVVFAIAGVFAFLNGNYLQAAGGVSFATGFTVSSVAGAPRTKKVGLVVMLAGGLIMLFAVLRKRF
jgi:hypothetical protein